MKLIVLGATGGTGLEIVRQATERGHLVTTLVRSPDRLKPFWDRIAVKAGDLLNSTDLQQAIQGHDAVVSAFGPRVPVSKADATLLQRFAVALTSAMSHTDVRRVVVESVAFLFKDSLLPPAYLLAGCCFRERLPMRRRWSKFSPKVDSIGQWCGHRKLRTSPTPASIACERAISPFSVSRSRARTWPIS
jgi:NAD(P)H-binding